MELRQKVISGLRWGAGAKFLGQLISWVITIIVMRLLAPGDYGLMAMAGVFIAFVALVNELGLGAALIQMKKIDDILQRQIFGVLLIINVCFFLMLLLIAPLIGSFFNDERVIPIVRLLSAQFILMPLTIIPQSILMREMNFKKLAIVDFVSAVAGSLTTLVLALRDLGVWALVWGSMAIIVGRTLGLNLISSHSRRPIFSVKDMTKTITFGGYVTLERILWFFYMRADTLIIGKLLGNELLGFYSVGMQLASLPMEKVSGIINQVAFPAYSNIQSDTQKVGTYFLKSVRVMSFLAFPILWGISSIAPELVSVFLGEKWYLAGLPFQMISLLVPIVMISNLMSPTLLGLGRADLSFSIVLLAFAVMPLAILIGVHWGIVGASLAWVIVFPLVFWFNLSKVVGVFGIRITNVFAAMSRSALTAFIMYATVMAIKLALGANGHSIGHLAVIIVCGAAVYGGTIAWLHRDGFRELLALLRVT